jgi:hypothetical protein
MHASFSICLSTRTQHGVPKSSAIPQSLLFVFLLFNFDFNIHTRFYLHDTRCQHRIAGL